MHIVSELHLLFQDKGGNQYEPAESYFDIWCCSLTWYLFEKVSPNASEGTVKAGRLWGNPGKIGRAEMLCLGLGHDTFSLVSKHQSQDNLTLTCLAWEWLLWFLFHLVLTLRCTCFYSSSEILVRIWPRVSEFATKLFFLCHYVTWFGTNNCT